MHAVAQKVKLAVQAAESFVFDLKIARNFTATLHLIHFFHQQSLFQYSFVS